MIRRQVVLPAAPGEVWRQLTDPDEVGEWMGGRVAWELHPGGPARFDGDDGSRRVGRIEEVEPDRRLRYRWWPEDGDGPASEVTYVLTPEEEGTEVTVTERTLAPVPQDSVGWTAWDSRLVGVWARASALVGARV
jgi:uncharacterized protein YndB with AHSA1/START domain